MTTLNERLNSSLARVKERGIAWAGERAVARRPHSPDNRFLSGPFAPVHVETTAYDLAIDGELPHELTGVFTRIGPNPVSVANPGAYHWFLGDGMVHGLRLRDGRAEWYRNRYVLADNTTAALGKPRLPGPRRGVFDTVNTNAIGHAGKLWAVVEAGAPPVELSPELESVKRGYFEDAASLPFTAHPHLDPLTGALHGIVYDGSASDRIRHVVIDREGKLAHTTEIAVKDGPMIHDCAITRKNVLVFDLPVTLSGKAFAQGVAFPYRWNAAHGARVGLLPKDGDASAIRWFSVDPCYVFHTANAFDLPDGGAVVDVVVHDTMFAHETDGPDSEKITFERWTLDAASGTVKRTVRSDDTQEFPRYDERRTGEAYRYAYTVTVEQSRESTLIRTDVESGEQTLRPFGIGRIPSETVFVPRAGGTDETDGWLMSYVYDAREDRSDVLVLSAADLTAPPQAVVHLPVRVPLGFHGNWVPDAS